MKGHEELFIRCDCGSHLVAVDLYAKQGADPVPKGGELSAAYEQKDYEDGYLSFYCSAFAYNLRGKIKLSWDVLRGRDAVYSCVILKPEDVTRLKQFMEKW